MLNPRILAALLAFSIAILATIFLDFVPDVSAGMLFVNFVATFLIAGILIFYALDQLIFKEVNDIIAIINQLKFKGLDLSRKKLIKHKNPLKKLNDDLSFYVSKKEKEVDELKRLAQYRREFLADVSHELKTPIFAAQGFVHTLIDGAMDDEAVRDKFLNKAAKSLDGLDALVRDLITVSQVESGDIKMNFEKIDLKKVTQETFEQLEPKATARETNLTIKINHQEANSQPIVRADARITQVMVNLIDNAIKYGKEKGTVSVVFDESKKHWQVSIKDDGPGIAPEHLNRIFERFYRIEKSRAKDRGGTGLGLSIVKHIVNAHHSKITVMSKPDRGTVFSFRLEKS